MSEAQGQELPADLVQRLRRVRDWAKAQSETRAQAAGRMHPDQGRPIRMSSIAMMVAVEVIDEFLGETQ